MTTDRTRLSRLLSWVLRHEPDAVGLTLDRAGWVDLQALVHALVAAGHRVSVDAVRDVVATSDKRRFELDGGRIRAAQGHTVPVELGLAEQRPPPVLWHGTVARSLGPILADGLRPMGRHAVHLSADPATARRVGARRGAPVVLRVDADAMVAAGHRFTRAANGVWLTEHVPNRFVVVQDAPSGTSARPTDDPG